MGGKASRTKGHAFERYVARRLQPYDSSARRNVEETQTASVDLKTKLPFGIQCKRMKAWPSPMAVYNQALDGVRMAQMNGVMPLGVIKIDRGVRTICLMAKAHFRVFFYDLIKTKKFKLVRRWKIKAKGRPPGKRPRDYSGTYKKRRSYKKNPDTMLCEAFSLCKFDEFPLVIWTNLETESRKLRTLYCFDFELLITQIEKIYGFEENRSYHL